MGRTRASALTALLCAAPAAGQHINRAAFLGLEGTTGRGEGLRRNFEQNASYFMDRMSYVSLPPWERDNPSFFASGIRYRFGSVSSDEFTVEGTIHHAVSLDTGSTQDAGAGAEAPRWRFNLDVLQSEHQDARFLKNAIGFEWDLDDTTAFFAQGEIVAEKPDIDVSLGAYLLRSERGALRLMATAVDFSNDKGKANDYEQDPYALMVSGWWTTRDHTADLSFDLSAQLPLRVRDIDSGDRLSLERYLGRIHGRLGLGAKDDLLCSIDAEYTDKERRLVDPVALTQESFDRKRIQVVTEWWHRFEDGWQGSVGASASRMDAQGRRPNDPLSSYQLEREEWFAIGRLRVPLSDGWALEPHLFAGYVRFDEVDGTIFSRSVEAFRGKLNANLRYAFSAETFLTFIVSAELHEPGFGGGGAQFVTRF